MISFFQKENATVLAVGTTQALSAEDIEKLTWLFSGAKHTEAKELQGWYIGPRREMITPWSTNAVEITQNMGIKGILRIEEYFAAKGADSAHDKMLQRIYNGLNQDIFTIDKQPDAIVYIDDIEAYNQSEGLALSPAEVEYLKSIEVKLGRKLTDSEVFGFSQVNSEHCRHKIFGGEFIIDGVKKESSLFSMIKRTSKENPNDLVSAYTDNVAFKTGPVIEQFAPASGDKPDYFEIKNIESVISVKAETHNFPTTVEPFNGAATGTGGEIRDRLGGGKASLPIAGTAVYMTSYPRTVGGRVWEQNMPERKWLYQTPEEILIKASNGASDFGNKFGQPIICGSLLTFEHQENAKKFAYDKVIMLAGGVGFANKRDAMKGEAAPGEKVVVSGGDNYRIGMGGGAVSSVNTGQYANAIELNAVQRANPEMQKRVANVIRTLAESDNNPIISIHDHGAGGHLNCLSELVETTGGKIDMDALPIGDPTLSAKEIIGNESQERMGFLLQEKDIDLVKKIADRERAPMYVVGETTGDHQFVFERKNGEKPIDLQMQDMIGRPPHTVITDKTVKTTYSEVTTDDNKIEEYLNNVLQLEAVACKDWLTNKVDRSVTGKIAKQQCAGEIQLPLNDLGAVSLDFRGKKGIATSLGHAPLVAMVDPAAGSVMSIAEALTNIVWAPLEEGLESISLSANWMWPCKNEGEDARLYEAVEACSNFAIDLGINIPTGKDSLSMTQKYGEDKVLAPGTVIITAAGQVSDVRNIISPVIIPDSNTTLYHVDFSFDALKLGGSALAQSLGKIGSEVPTVKNPEYFQDAFNTIQKMIKEGLILAGHDISEGGMIVTLLEMCFGNTTGGLNIQLKDVPEPELAKILFSENPGVIIQVKDCALVEKTLSSAGVGFAKLGKPIVDRELRIAKEDKHLTFNIDTLRDTWFKSSYLLDRKQSGEECAKERFENYKSQPLVYHFNDSFSGKLSKLGLNADRKTRSGIKAAIIRDKGTNGEREMAYTMWLAGFDVKDVHMTDLASGRETLDDVNFIVFCGGFSNSDVLGSAKGWAGGFLYNEKAKAALDRFYSRPDTLSLGICNGCQLMVELGLIYPEDAVKPKMLHNNSHKFESTFVGLTIPENDSVMLKSLSGTKLGVWVAHGEGKFWFPENDESKYKVVAKFNYDSYPANPNGSMFSTAAIASRDGRHLAMMPHPERAIFPWQCAYYPVDRVHEDEVTPWIEAFVNAKNWIKEHKK
ncbi:MAG: phosphoribosylformylglycinamidine synthase [Paludibacteraceae bacterium]|nr:phosphoribosylformylglycinamidine synthase [Paludibacteraceae bacterium]